MKKNLSTVILILVFLTGLSLLLYPSVSDYWNSFHQSHAIATYASEVAALDDDAYDEMWAAAQDYNQRLAKRENPLMQSEEDLEEYETLLNLNGTGVMGYIEIPELKVSLPVYHGVDEGVLQIAVGHIPPAGRGPTASSPATGACPPPSCSPTWTSCGRGTSSCSGSWTRR